MQNKTAVCISCEQDSHIKKFLHKEASIMPVYCMFPLLKIKVIMQGKLFQRCTHLLYCSVLSLGGNVNIRRMSKPDMGSIFHIKKSMKYSGHRKLLCELSKLSKFNAFNLLGYYKNTDASMLVYKFRP